MNPAAYTPTTLARIRQGATAAQLGWPQDRFERICAKHGIERGPVAKPAAHDAAAADDKPSVNLSARREPKRKTRAGIRIVPDPLIVAGHEPHWSSETCEFTCGSLKVVIAGRVQSRALNELYKSYRTDPRARVSKAVLASAAGTTPASVSTSMRDLSARLRRVGWCAHGFKSIGGWRLERFDPQSVASRVNQKTANNTE